MGNRFSIRSVLLLIGLVPILLISLWEHPVACIVHLHPLSEVQFASIGASDESLPNARLVAPVFEKSSTDNSQRNRVEEATGVLADDVMDSLKTKYANDKGPLKVHSSLVLALEHTHRKRVILQPLKKFLSPEEFVTACESIYLQRDRYNDLLERRIAIMQRPYRELIPELLRYNDIATVVLTRKISAEITSDTFAQRKRNRLARKRQDDR